MRRAYSVDGTCGAEALKRTASLPSSGPAQSTAQCWVGGTSSRQLAAAVTVAPRLAARSDSVAAAQAAWSLEPGGAPAVLQEILWRK